MTEEQHNKRIRIFALILFLVTVATAFIPPLHIALRIAIPLIGTVISALLALLTFTVVQ